ncbi:MAG TPA: inorganic diphosphatase [Candidatus Xenobia bacterium]
MLIEIPAGSFVKRSWRDGRWHVDFFSPLPSLFNYGHVPATRAEDGMPQDVVVMGRRLAAGTRLGVHPVARIRFTDQGVRDDKIVAVVVPRPLRGWETWLLRLFFQVYAAFKRLRGSPCSFEGLVEERPDQGG